MNGLERFTGDYGGGSGQTVFEGEHFRVVVMRLQKGTVTRVYCKLHPNLVFSFDEVIPLNSDEACMDQMTSEEILGCIEYQKQRSYEHGRRSKREEMLAVLNED